MSGRRQWKAAAHTNKEQTEQKQFSMATVTHHAVRLTHSLTPVPTLVSVSYFLHFTDTNTGS